MIKDVTAVIFAKSAFLDRLTLRYIKEFTLEKNLSSVRFARKVLVNWEL